MSANQQLKIAQLNMQFLNNRPVKSQIKMKLKFAVQSTNILGPVDRENVIFRQSMIKAKKIYF